MSNTANHEAFQVSSNKRQKADNEDDDGDSIFSTGVLKSVLGLPHEYMAGSFLDNSIGQEASPDSSSRGHISSSVAANIQLYPLDRSAHFELGRSFLERGAPILRVGEDEISDIEGDSPPKEDAGTRPFY